MKPFFEISVLNDPTQMLVWGEDLHELLGIVEPYMLWIYRALKNYENNIDYQWCEGAVGDGKRHMRTCLMDIKVAREIAFAETGYMLLEYNFNVN